MIISLVGCKEKPQDLFEFERDETLNKYLENDNQIIGDIKSNPIGSTGPQLSYVNDKYAVILSYNGILIYDLGERKIINTIDNKALGLDKIQGDDRIVIRGYEDYVALWNNLEENFAYV